MADGLGDKVDFFVSYAGPDRPWAEWAASQLEATGYTVELDVWDWEVGSNFVLNMDGALERARRVLALFSSAYFERERFTFDEWTAVSAEPGDHDGRRRLIPVRVEDIQPPRILAPLIYRDLFGLDEQRAREVLLEAVAGSRHRPESPRFPGMARPVVATAVPRPPGTLPAVWNVPHRHPGFTGREAQLAALRQQLASGSRALVQALHGMGGVGKTQLTIEYAHLFSGEYELVWWVDAERAELIGEQLAALAAAANWAELRSTTAAAVKCAMSRFRAMGRWLVVFDNAASAEQLAPWLPAGPGHVIITSRNDRFASLAAPVPVDVFTRSESITLLKRYLPTVSDVDADRLAEEMADLPLALTQAAGLISETRMSMQEYLLELRHHGAELLAEGKPAAYPVPLAAVIETSLNRLNAEDTAAVQLLHLCALLAPEPISLVWLTSAPAGILEEPLAAVVTARLTFRQALGRLARTGLSRVTESTVQLHRFTQAVLRDQCSTTTDDRDRVQIERVIAAAAPDAVEGDPDSWPAWAALLPHLLALDPPHAGPHLRHAARRGLRYLMLRGQYHLARDLAQTWYAAWLDRFGPDHHEVLVTARYLAHNSNELGEHQQARSLGEDALNRCRRVLGVDHPDTLAVASQLGVSLAELGEFGLARELNEDTLARHRRILGEDHPDTLQSAHHLGFALSALGAYEDALSLDQDTAARRRRVLGENNVLTMATIINVAENLRVLGQLEEARRVNDDNYGRARRVLGVDHPTTLVIALNLARILLDLGDPGEARRWDEDTLARARHVLGEGHPVTNYAREGLASDLRALDKPAERPASARPLRD